MDNFLPFVTEGERTPYAPITLQNYQPSTWEIVKHSWAQGGDFRFGQQGDNTAAGMGASRFWEEFDYEAPDIDVVADAQERLASPEPCMPIDEQQRMIDEHGLTGQIKPHARLKEEDLQILIDGRKAANLQNFITSRATFGQSIAGMGASMAAGFLDPAMIASMMIPVVPQAKAAEMLGKYASSWAGRAWVRTKIGALTGAVGAAMLEPVMYAGETTAQRDYSLANSLLNIGGGAVLGGAMHAGFGAFGEFLRNKGFLKGPNSWEYVPTTADTERMMRDHAYNIYKARMDANPALDRAKVQEEANHAAMIYDAMMRHYAYKEQVTPDAFYRRFEMDWMSGKVYDRYLQNVQKFGREYEALSREIEQVEARRAMLGNAEETGLRNIDDGFDLQAAKDRLEVVGEKWRKTKRVLAAENDNGRLRAENSAKLNELNARYNELSNEVNLTERRMAAGLEDVYTRQKMLVEMQAKEKLLTEKQAELVGMKSQSGEEAKKARSEIAAIEKEVADMRELLADSPQTRRWLRKNKPLLKDLKQQIDDLEYYGKTLRSLNQTVDPQTGMLPPDILGSTYTDAKGRSVLRLFERHNTSTVIHEMGHAIRRQMEIISKQPHAQLASIERYKALERQFGVEPGGAWTRDQEEAFARSFEQYLLLGNAPNAQVAGAFEAIKERMTEIYSNADALGAPISKDVRKLFNDMFTTPAFEGEQRFQRALAEFNTERFEAEFNDLDGSGRLERLYQEAGLDAGRIENASAEELAGMRKQLETLTRDSEDTLRSYFEHDTDTNQSFKKQLAREHDAAMEAYAKESEEIAERGKIIEEYLACVL